MVKKTHQRAFVLMFLLLAAGAVNAVYAQNIGQGVDAASSEVKGVFANLSNFALVIGGVVGLIGGIRVFIIWQSGEKEIQKHVVGWLSACLFLLLAGTILKTMFNM